MKTSMLFAFIASLMSISSSAFAAKKEISVGVDVFRLQDYARQAVVEHYKKLGVKLQAKEITILELVSVSERKVKWPNGSIGAEPVLDVSVDPSYVPDPQDGMPDICSVQITRDIERKGDEWYGKVTDCSAYD